MDNGDVYDGSFSRGAFNGYGVYYNFENNSFLHAMFVDSKPINVLLKGLSYPAQIIGRWVECELIAHLNRRLFAQWNFEESLDSIALMC